VAEIQTNTEASEISVKLVREIFSEMFKKQQKDILKLISGNLKITNERIDGLLKELTEIKETCKTLQNENNLRKFEMVKTNDRVSKIEHTQKDIENSITFTQDTQEEKINKIEEKIVSKVAFNAEEKNKLRQLEDRLRRNNLRLEGITESESES
jgi:plasmid maintenance system antidote protein VapI